MPEIVVIGGGAAGIAAARRLHGADRDVLLIEARGDIGGRARSVALALPAGGSATVDLGCGWLHSARRNPWAAIAAERGFDIRTDAANWGVQWRNLGYPPADRAAFATARSDWSARAHAALAGRDRSLADFVDPADRWTPLLDAISGFANGASLADVSLHDWAAYEDHATEDNWALPAGYGTLVAGHAMGLRVRSATPATRIDHGGRRVRIETPAGTIEADAVVIAIPTPAYRDLRFDPPLPDKHAAADALPLGLADKAFIAVDGPEWPDDSHLMGNPYVRCTASHRLSPFGLPLIESFFGGDCAEMLEEGDAAAFAIDELVTLLGAAWRPRLHPLTATRWRHEPFVHGSYSHARIGCASWRAVLAEPVGDRLFFAGEACSQTDFSTAHGAYATGVAAADALIARFAAA